MRSYPLSLYLVDRERERERKSILVTLPTPKFTLGRPLMGALVLLWMLEISMGYPSLAHCLYILLKQWGRERESPSTYGKEIIFLKVFMMLDRSNSQELTLLHYRRACSLLAPATCWKSNKCCAITHANPKKVTQKPNISISWQIQLFKWCHQIILKKRIINEENNNWRDFRNTHANKMSKLRLIWHIAGPGGQNGPYLGPQLTYVQYKKTNWCPEVL
jgi:hypothetical protein